MPTWDARISPVFDVAKRLLVVDIEDGRDVRRDERDLFETDPVMRTRRVVELGVTVLICGAVSRSLEVMMASAGVRVIPEICGPIEDVLRAFVSGQLRSDAFRMPGCCGRRRRLRGQHDREDFC